MADQPGQLPDEQVGADLGAGAPDRRKDPLAPEEEFQSPMSVAGLGPGGRRYRTTSPSEQNPAADPGADEQRG